jgi:hypothetical protein
MTREVNNTLKAAGFSDFATGFMFSKEAIIKSWKAVPTSAFGTTAAAVQLGTVSSAGLFGTATVPTTGVVGEAVAGTILLEGVVPPNTLLVIDQAVSTGNGAYVVVIEFEFAE